MLCGRRRKKTGYFPIPRWDWRRTRQHTPLARRHEIELNKDQIIAGQAGLYAGALFKGLEILYGIYTTAREILDVQKELLANSSQEGWPLDTEEACKVLRVSKTKLGLMRSSGAHIDGVHYWQDESTVRYFPDFATKPLKPVNEEQKESPDSDNIVKDNAQCAMDPDY